ncbi:hypothetical protein JCGZ_16744 [Jatropha curcas]|uniref:Anthocyanin acyltransferase n=2 Tax=Jatropha curcas TaxID=180498 RepID=A0A067L4V4_JATCU|nr:hypothetical protein JCGZ_16744 [Jatropha curcas]
MAKSSMIKVLENWKVSPPPNSAPSTTLPLTFFDIPWLFFSPSQPLFFYEYPHSTSHFLSFALPNLKLSLSLALKHFFPFLGNLVLSSCDSKKPKILYNAGDYVSFTIQESSGDFSYFVSNHARDVHEFYPLVPDLAITSSEPVLIHLFAVKVTIFSQMGFCLGLAYQHVAADGRTFNNFIKAWASLCANSSFLTDSFPSFDRSVIKDTDGLEEIFLKELWKRKSSHEVIIGTAKTHVDLSNMVRETFLVSPSDMERIKKWIIGKCKKKNQPIPIHLSPYVLTCSFIWVCLVKTQTQIVQGENYHYSSEDPNYLGFIVGGLTRLDYPVPATYFGNCVGFGRPMAIRGELMGKDGIVVAANVIGNMIRKLDKEFLYGAENWISDWEVLFGSEVHLLISGSPKLDLYETDFGWGRPKKIEDISIDSNRAISLIESRDVKGGIEVGLALSRPQMEVFSSLFVGNLKMIFSEL